MSLKHLIPKSIRGRIHWCRAKIVAMIKKTGHLLGLGKFIWKVGLPSEIGFWDNYLETRGKSCDAEAEFKFRTSPDSGFQPWLKEWLPCPAGAEVRVLDVGAGPLTWVGKKWEGCTVRIDAIDPLAEAYGTIMKRCGINPPVWTKAGNGEEIVEKFGREVFDLTFARNSLDHSYDAMVAVASMVEATKSGGIIFLWHNQDEAESLNYQGLHQWNFRLEKGELLVWKGKKVLNVNQHFANKIKPLQCEFKDDMIQAIYRKL